jgi:hypothetical protein
MPGGRPTKYSDEILEKARDYIDSYECYGHPFPSEVGLSEALSVAKSTIKDWKSHEDKEEFSAILDQINTRQQMIAWDKGLKGEYNANLVKLLLGKHGYSDKVEQETTATVKVTGELSDEELERIANGK